MAAESAGGATPRTLHDVLAAHLAAAPDAPFLIAPETGRTMRYRDIAAETRALASMLDARGMHLTGISAYASTKAALNMISDTAREELASDNIRITTMFPNATATNFGNNSLATPKTNQQGPRPRPGGPVPDSAEAVAQKILEAARNEPHDQYMDR